MSNNVNGKSQTTLILITYVFLSTGCSTSYQGERVTITQEMLHKVENMSIDDAVEIIRLYFQQITEKYASNITSEEWEKMKKEMDVTPWRQRQLTTANLEQSRRTWYGWIANRTSITVRTYLEDFMVWEHRGTGMGYIEEFKPVPPEVQENEYRYNDIVELRSIKNSNGKSGIRIYSKNKKGDINSFWLYPEEKDLDSLTIAFIKLCPNIRKSTVK